MNKKVSLYSMLLVLGLTGCSLATPMGTVEYRPNDISKDYVFTDDKGNTTVMKSEKVEESLNAFLEGLSTDYDVEGVKDGINAVLKNLGVDTENMDESFAGLSEEDIKGIKEDISDVLQKNNIEVEDEDLDFLDKKAE